MLWLGFGPRGQARTHIPGRGKQGWDGTAGFLVPMIGFSAFRRAGRDATCRRCITTATGRSARPDHEAQTSCRSRKAQSEIDVTGFGKNRVIPEDEVGITENAQTPEVPYRLRVGCRCRSLSETLPPLPSTRRPKVTFSSGDQEVCVSFGI